MSHNGRGGVSNHHPHDCLLNRSFRPRSKKTSKLRVTAIVRGIHRGPVNSSHKWPVTRKMSPFDDVIMNISVPCVPMHIINFNQGPVPNRAAIFRMPLRLQLCDDSNSRWDLKTMLYQSLLGYTFSTHSYIFCFCANKMLSVIKCCPKGFYISIHLTTVSSVWRVFPFYFIRSFAFPVNL